MADAIAKAAGVPGELARRALMLSGDLPGTAQLALAEGEEGLRGVGFRIFQPILPMLASTAESVENALEGFERGSVEWKLDGIRIQIHRRGDDVRVYTRNLNDITLTFPARWTRCSGCPSSRRCWTARRSGSTRRARPSSSTFSISTARTCSTFRSSSAPSGSPPSRPS